MEIKFSEDMEYIQINNFKGVIWPFVEMDIYGKIDNCLKYKEEVYQAIINNKHLSTVDRYIFNHLK